MNSASTSFAILLYDVQGQDHVMEPLNSKAKQYSCSVFPRITQVS